jgi:hypothetical protein
MSEQNQGDGKGPPARAGVEFVIQEPEIPALDYAGPRIVGPDNYLLLKAPVNSEWEPIPGGEPTLEIYVDALDLDAAQEEAERLYAEMRVEGALPPQPKPRVIGLFMSFGEDAPWLRHFNEAQGMFAQKRYELAVITAQIACEVEVRAVIDEAADAPEESLARIAIDGPRTYSLIDRRAQAVLKAVIGRSPTSERFWTKYKDHVRRRNNIVHSGARVTRADAAESIEVAEDFVNWLHSVRPHFDGPFSLGEIDTDP